MSKTFSIVCQMCSKVFEAKRSTYVCCSRECISAKIAQTQKKITEEKIQKLKEMRLSWKTLDEMEAEVGLSRPTIIKILKQEKLIMTKEETDMANQKKWDRVERYDEKGRLRCCLCEEWKPPYDFGTSKKTPTGKNYSCKECQRNRHKKIAKSVEERTDIEMKAFIDDFLKDYKIKSPSEEGHKNKINNSTD